MKRNDIKEMIRQSILAEFNMNEDYDVETGNSDVGLRDLYANNVNEASLNPKDIQRKYNEMFGKNPSTKFADVAKALGRPEEEVTMTLMGVGLPKLKEAEEEEISDEETIDIKAPAPDVPADMPADTTMVAEPTYTPEEAALMGDLDDALKKSQDINDEKLSTLIGNIITYFTRQHVVKEGEAGRKKHYKGAVKDDEDQISKLKKDMKFDKKQLKTESLEILKMKKLAGLLTEGEYAKALLKENEDSEVDMYGDPYVAANYVYQYNKQFDPFEPQDKKRNPSKLKENIGLNYMDVKGKTVIISLHEEDDEGDIEENKEFRKINNINDFRELVKDIKKYEEMGILDEYYIYSK